MGMVRMLVNVLGQYQKLMGGTLDGSWKQDECGR